MCVENDCLCACYLHEHPPSQVLTFPPDVNKPSSSIDAAPARYRLRTEQNRRRPPNRDYHITERAYIRLQNGQNR